MAIYKCSICGAIFDEEKEGKKFSELTCCPVCKQPPSKFECISEEASEENPPHIKVNFLMTPSLNATIKAAVIWKKSIRWQ